MTDPLRRLDERFVPRLARFFNELIPPAPEPTGPLPVILRLRRVDDRFTQRGPLALIREIPQFGALLIAAIVLASGVTAGIRNADRQAREGTTEQGEAPAGDSRTAIGPQIGDAVPEYIGETQRRLGAAFVGEPDAQVVAVVQLDAYRTAKQVDALLGGRARVRRLFYRIPVPLPATSPDELEVQKDFVGESSGVFRRIIASHQEEIRNLTSMIATNDHDPVQKKEDESRLADFKRQVAALDGGDCACIYGVLVETRLQVLVDLSDRLGIRAIDISVPKAAVEDYQNYTALLPEEKVTVTAGNQEG